MQASVTANQATTASYSLHALKVIDLERQRSTKHVLKDR